HQRELFKVSDHAILIGIKYYPGLSDAGASANLDGPENDIAAMKSWLLDPAGGQLNPDGSTVHEFRATVDQVPARPSSDELETVLGDLKRIAERNPAGRFVGRRLYMYMSGHGFSPAPQRGCLITPNATGDQTLNIHATGWLSWLQDSGL